MSKRVRKPAAKPKIDQKTQAILTAVGVSMMLIIAPLAERITALEIACGALVKQRRRAGQRRRGNA